MAAVVIVLLDRALVLSSFLSFIVIALPFRQSTILASLRRSTQLTFWHLLIRRIDSYPRT